MPEPECKKTAMLVARMASCCVADSFSTRLKLIRPKSSLKNVKMSKKRVFFSKKLQRVNGLKKKEAILLAEGGTGGTRCRRRRWGLMLGWYLKINFGRLKI